MPDKKFRGISNLPVAIPDVPDAPTVSASNVGTSRAYNNGAATVTITSPTGGLPTSYSVTTTPSTTTTTATSSPVTLTGLASATSYTVTATPTNVSATGPATTSSAITATTVPNAPTIGTFTDSGTGTTGTLSFTAPATGGSAITNYSYSTDSSTYTALSPAQTSSPLSLTGLTAGTYNFSVKAVNANGTSAASGTVSGTVITPSSFESIATTTVGSGGSATVTFSSIPSTYTHLQIRGIGKGSVSYGGGGELFLMQLNSDTGYNYAWHQLKGNGSTASASATVSTNSINVSFGSNNNASLANMFAGFVIDILDYANTNKYKTVRSLSGADTNATLSNNDEIDLRSGLWQSTSAVSTITFSIAGANYAQYSQFALYGIKGA